MAFCRSPSGDFYRLPQMAQTILSPKFSPELTRRISAESSLLRFSKPISSSTCNSADSGLDQTLNLTPPSPASDDSDLSDSNFSEGFSSLSSGLRKCRVRRSLDNHPYRDPCEAYNVNQTVCHYPAQGCEPTNRDVRNFNQSYQSQPSLQQNDNRFHVLSFEQVQRLHNLLNETMPIYSRINEFPTVWVRPSELFHAVQTNLQNSGVPVRNVRLNGGAASYVIGADASLDFNDIDILISVDLSSHTSIIQRVKCAVLDALVQFLPAEQRTTAFSNTNKEGPMQFKHLRSSAAPSHITRLQNSATSNVNTTLYQKNFLESSQQTKIYDGPTLNEPVLWSLDDSSVSSFPQQLTLALNAPVTHIPVVKQSIKFIPEQNAYQSMVAPLSHVVTSPCTTNLGALVSIPGSANHQPIPSSDMSIRESYIFKQFRKFSPHDSDCWSLLSIGVPSNQSKVVEFKFVDRMRRQFEFTVDSFQIHLDSIISYMVQKHSVEITPNFYPTVVAESVACSYSLALHHLTNKIIVTKEPEAIRGGGLLKYCRLLVNGYQSPEGVDICSLERYMCSRFFIDFQDLASQRCKIEAFLENHFKGEEIQLKILFLRTVYRVVSGSTICLMSFERFQTLNIIMQLIQQLNKKSQATAISFSIDTFAKQQNLSVDRIFFGTQLFPNISPSRCACDNIQYKSTGVPEVDSSCS